MKLNKMPSDWPETTFSAKVEPYLLDSEEVIFASSSTPGFAKEMLVITNYRLLRLNKGNGEILVGTCWISNIQAVNVNFGVLVVQPVDDKFYSYNLKDKPFSIEIMNYILERSKEIAENGNPEFVVGLMPWSKKNDLITEAEAIAQANAENANQPETTNNVQNVQNMAKLGLLASFFLDE